MAYEKIKEESYSNLLGINVKASDCATDTAYVLDLRNYTFVKPGAWTSRPGTGVHASLAVSSFSLMPKNLFQFIKDTGASYLLFSSGQTGYILNGVTPFCPSLGSGEKIWGAETQENRFYFSNIDVWRAFLGDSFYDVNMFTQHLLFDPGLSVTIVGFTFNTSLITSRSSTLVIRSGAFFAYPGNSRNASLPPEIHTIPTFDSNLDNGAGGGANLSATLVVAPGLGRWLLYGATVFRQNQGVSLWFMNLFPPGSSQSANAFNPLSALASTLMPISYTTFGGAVTLGYFEFDHYTSGLVYRKQQLLGLLPKYLKTYNNMMFAANVTNSATAFRDNAGKSKTWVSEIGNPEAYEASSFFEIITDDGDEITAVEIFQDSLLIFKKRSVHEINGTDPDSLTARELTREYGCVNNRSIAVYNNRLWFMDPRGEIIEYNGANFADVSEPVFSLISEINQFEVRALHVKKMNQVWFCASNKVFSFDYNIGAWTIFDNLSINESSGANVISYGATIKDVSWWESGASYHNLVRFNDSLNTDQGSAITLIAKTRFHKVHGDSTQELFRRLFINCDIPGSTQGITFLMRPDYGTSVYTTRSAYLDSFQKRLDFGVSAKSMSVEMIVRASQSIVINGYTVESRFLRKV